MTRFLINADIEIKAESEEEAERMVFSVLGATVNVNCEKTVNLTEEENA